MFGNPLSVEEANRDGAAEATAAAASSILLWVWGRLALNQGRIRRFEAERWGPWCVRGTKRFMLAEWRSRVV